MNGRIRFGKVPTVNQLVWPWAEVAAGAWTEPNTGAWTETPAGASQTRTSPTHSGKAQNRWTFTVSFAVPPLAPA